ncbi:MAG: hypothetical protein WKF81_01470 [Thermomicrobiales bacterium]
MDDPTIEPGEPRDRELSIVIVGPCASGKSTLAVNLREIGINARVSGQEHSEISSLWRRQDPDMVIGLHIDLETLRQRRGSSWSEWLFESQLRRLHDAYAAAGLHIDTVMLSESEALQAVLRHLESKGP